MSAPERMPDNEFLALGVRLFNPTPSAKDGLDLLKEAQRARGSETDLLAWKEEALQVFNETGAAHDETGIVGESTASTLRRLFAERNAALDALEGIRDSAKDGRDVPEWLSERLDEVRALLKKAGRR